MGIQVGLDNHTRPQAEPAREVCSSDIVREDVVEELQRVVSMLSEVELWGLLLEWVVLVHWTHDTELMFSERVRLQFQWLGMRDRVKTDMENLDVDGAYRHHDLDKCVGYGRLTVEDAASSGWSRFLKFFRFIQSLLLVVDWTYFEMKKQLQELFRAALFSHADVVVEVKQE